MPSMTPVLKSPDFSGFTLMLTSVMFTLKCLGSTMFLALRRVFSPKISPYFAAKASILSFEASHERRISDISLRDNVRVSGFFCSLCSVSISLIRELTPFTISISHWSPSDRVSIVSKLSFCESAGMGSSAEKRAFTVSLRSIEESLV